MTIDSIAEHVSKKVIWGKMKNENFAENLTKICSCMHSAGARTVWVHVNTNK